MSDQQQNDELGALWLKESKKGTKYMSGKIEVGGEAISIVIFKNNKKKETHPDYRILRSDSKSEQSSQQSTQEQAVRDTFEDDVPF